MSGGAFDYKQWEIRNIADQIEHKIEINGNKKEHRDSWDNDEYTYEYPADIIEEFKNAVKHLKIAHIYA